MKTFTSIQTFPEGTCGYREDSRRIFLIEADPKRDGLYKMSEFQTNQGGKADRFSMYYGKCNQAKILELSEDMIEVI